MTIIEDSGYPLIWFQEDAMTPKTDRARYTEDAIVRMFAMNEGDEATLREAFAAVRATLRADLIERVEGLRVVKQAPTTYPTANGDYIAELLDRDAVLALLRDDKEAGGG